MQLLEHVRQKNQDLINRFCPFIGKLIITSAYLFNTAFRLLIPSDGCEPTRLETLEAQSFFIPFSIGIVVWSFQKIDTVFEFVFFEFSIYTVIKEILGTGADIDLWEIFFWIIALLFTWKKFKSDRH